MTATVKAASGAVPTGSVNFYINSTLVSTLQLSNGTAVYSATVSMEPGTYQMVAKYAGDSIDNASTSATATFTVVATTATTITSGATQVVEGSPVALTASVTPQWGDVTATGAVTFYIGQTALGNGTLNASGQTSVSPPINLPPGQYPAHRGLSGRQRRPRFDFESVDAHGHGSSCPSGLNQHHPVGYTDAADPGSEHAACRPRHGRQADRPRRAR